MAWMRTGRAIVLAALALATVGAAPARPAGPQILTSDVERFYRVYDQAGGHPTAAQLDHDYLAPGSQGLHEFMRLRNVSGARMADAMAKTPETWVKARRCLAALPAVKRRLTASFRKLADLYPEARFPPVTIVVGRGRPVGITNPAGVTIGLEALCAADFMNPNLEDRFVRVIAHEYGHIQQPDDIQAFEPGMPGVTVLKASLIEGTAELTSELISGDVANWQHKAWTRGHEAEIEAAFVGDMDKTDASAWLSNGPGDAAHPGDLGYWVGHRIVKTYYDHAKDKRRALKEIYAIRDEKAFLAKSGWRPEKAGSGAPSR
jgi:hypothetical protein